MWRLALTAVGAIWAAGCFRPDEHRCADDTACGAGGRCEPTTGYCAFAAPECCGAPWRYGEGAGDLSGACVSALACGDAAGRDDGAVTDAAPIDAAIDASPIDAPPPIVVAHLAAADAQLGVADWVIDADVTIDTTAASASAPLPTGVGLTVASQQPSGGALVVLHVRGLSVRPNKRLRVVGTRPLIVVASVVSVAGVIDASAAREVPGAGGSGPMAGTGAGGIGGAAAPYEGGSGGAGFGTAGALGGASTGASAATGGSAGPAYGTPSLTLLSGGSGGGNGTTGVACSGAVALGGAGGGALQLTATTSLTIASTGAVIAGGGGGGAGRLCAGNSEPARGGGSGGAIYLQAATIDVAGVVAANGGGGGGASISTAMLSGTAGADGGAAATPAAGGMMGTFASGGAGGALATAPTVGRSTMNSDGGGGGGAVGRIVLRGTASVTGTVSPAPTSLPP